MPSFVHQRNTDHGNTMWTFHTKPINLENWFVLGCLSFILKLVELELLQRFLHGQYEQKDNSHHKLCQCTYGHVTAFWRRTNANLSLKQRLNNCWHPVILYVTLHNQFENYNSYHLNTLGTSPVLSAFVPVLDHLDSILWDPSTDICLVLTVAMVMLLLKHWRLWRKDTFMIWHLVHFQWNNEKGVWHMGVCAGKKNKKTKQKGHQCDIWQHGYTVTVVLLSLADRWMSHLTF